MYSDEKRLIGQVYQLGPDDVAVLRTGQAAADVSDLSQPENRFERAEKKLLQVYVTVHTPSGQVLLFEAYHRYSAVQAAGQRVWWAFAPWVLGALAVLELVQVPLAWAMARRLQHRKREREQLLRRAVEASDAERRRIASDLHDGVVQDLAAVSFSLAAVSESLPVGTSTDVASTLAEAASGTRRSIRSLRSMLVEIYLGPPDVQVDAKGIVWVSLKNGNAIARIDPAVATPGSPVGIAILPLAPCAPELCNAFPVLPPPPTPDLPSRAPAQMVVTLDAAGNTVLWYAEERANAIGVMQVSSDGRELAKADIPCRCVAPSGIALDAQGVVWFAGRVSNQILRLVPNLADLAVAAVDAFPIPSSVLVVDPVRPPANTSNPHSVAVDPDGRVWFTEESTGKLGWLDPKLVKPGISQGVTELKVPNTDFNSQAAPADLVIDRAGTVFFVDEYGDQVGTATRGGIGRRWRPSTRISHPDHPIVDSRGDLWFTESAAGLITRFSGVATAALPTPSPTPTPTPTPSSAPTPTVTPTTTPIQPAKPTPTTTTTTRTAPTSAPRPSPRPTTPTTQAPTAVATPPSPPVPPTSTGGGVLESARPGALTAR